MPNVASSALAAVPVRVTTIPPIEQAGVDAVVVNSAGSGSAMKEYGLNRM